MASSKAPTVAEYLDELPEERRDVIVAVRKVVLKNLPKGYREEMSYGMIGYNIPLQRYPATYNGQPLAYAGIAAQKHFYAIYLMVTPEQAAWIKSEYKRLGMKLDMGKSCLRFKKLEDVALDLVGKVVASTTPEAYIERYEASGRGGRSTGA